MQDSTATANERTSLMHNSGQVDASHRCCLHELSRHVKPATIHNQFKRLAACSTDIFDYISNRGNEYALPSGASKEKPLAEKSLNICEADNSSAAWYSISRNDWSAVLGWHTSSVMIACITALTANPMVSLAATFFKSRQPIKLQNTI